MKRQRIGKRILTAGFIAVIFFMLMSFVVSPTVSTAKTGKTPDADTMEVHFIDVGQGDSTLVMCGGHAMLIDAGDDSMGTAIQNYLQKRQIGKLDYLVLTHPDSDHIGGAPVIITKFKIDNVFVSNFEKDNRTYQKLMEALDNKRFKYETPKVGSQYMLGSATITILAPNQEYDDPNNASVALLLQNGENRFLFTGDAQEEAEQDILENGIDILADVYKAGHHGSKTSTCEAFLEAVSPRYAVISCGEDNSFGHPHAETLNLFRKNGVSVYRTDESGSVIAISDGTDITFSVPTSDTWKAGEPTGNSTGKETPQKGTAIGATEKNTIETGDTLKKELTYVLNVKTKKFHRPSCGSLPTANRKDTTDSRDSVVAQGYSPCKRCNP